MGRRGVSNTESRDANKVMSKKTVKGHLERKKRERWVLTGGCLQICLHQTQAPVGIITVEAYTHTQTNAHTDAQ